MAVVLGELTMLQVPAAAASEPAIPFDGVATRPSIESKKPTKQSAKATEPRRLTDREIESIFTLPSYGSDVPTSALVVLTSVLLMMPLAVTSLWKFETVSGAAT